MSKAKLLLSDGKPVEAFAQADRTIGKGKELADKLRALGKYVGRDVLVRVKAKGFSALTGKEVAISRTVKMRPRSAAEIRAKYFEIIRNSLNKWRAKFEANPEANGWYDDISVASSGFDVELPQEGAPPKKKPQTQYVAVRGVRKFKKVKGKWQKRRGDKWVKSSRAEVLKAKKKGATRGTKAKRGKAKRRK